MLEEISKIAVDVAKRKGATVVIGYNRGADRAETLRASLPGSGHCTMMLPLEDGSVQRVAVAPMTRGGTAGAPSRQRPESTRH